MKHSSFTMLKSALKKSCTGDISNERRVSFSKTVQIYGNSIKPEYVPDKYNEKINESTIDIELFSIETMIQAMKTDSFDSSLNEDPTDFFVHKVVYDNEDQLNDSSEDLKVTTSENQEFSPNNSDTENEEFVVHQVTLHEEDASDESECESNSQTPCKEETVCELSIQNIEQHNILTESQLLLDCEIIKPITMATLSSSDIILSPPLQELGVNRLICPQNDKWFWNLDISPLNSVQESDSESNVSSEDTMIMMTSEECAKNEQKIQESLQKFESLKKQHSKTYESQSEFITNQVPLSNKCELPSIIENPVNSTLLNDTSDFHAVPNVGNSKISAEVIDLEAVQLQICDDASVAVNTTVKSNETTEKTSNNSLSSYLVTVEIPNDVREWKIPIDKGQMKKEFSNNSENKSINLKSFSESTSFGVVELVHQTDKSLNTSEHYTDELEHFVDQCTERVERIRKRYSINENMLWTPRRGIRPRFGSSTAILQHFSSGNHSLLPSVNINNNHYSWPYYISEDHTEKHKLMKPHSTGVLTNFVDNFQRENLHKPLCTKNISIGGLQQFFKNSGRNGINWSVVNGQVDTLSPFSSNDYGESPSESLLKSNWVPNGSEIQNGSESIVYYSMQV